jgi:hypothetical protein
MLSWRPKEWKDEDILTVAAILSYEVGDFVKCIVKSKTYAYDEKLVKAYLAEAKIALSDVEAMVALICEILDMRKKDVEALGIQRFAETMAHIKARKRSY